MGFDIGKIGGVNKVYKAYSVDKKKEVKGVANIEGKKDELSISQKAIDYNIVGKGLGIIKSLPDIRAEKVGEVKDQIEKGTYDVNGKDVAEKLLSDKFDKKI